LYTALFRVFSDLLLTIDSGKSAVLVLLDPPAAFDAADHNILLSRLKQCVGTKGSASTWFKSYLTEGSFSVNLGDCSSSSAPLIFGVPQPSILGPILFNLYVLPVGSIFRKHDIPFHCFADDIQVFLLIKSNSKNPVESLLDCLSDLQIWLKSNFLNFNESKTD